jgi:mRNA interferase RelE/StbE
MVYHVEFGRSAAKQFTKLPRQDQIRLKSRLDALSRNPRPRGAIKLKGEEEALFRLRAGDYRILYQVKDCILLVLVLKVAHRKEVYR